MVSGGRLSWYAGQVAADGDAYWVDPGTGEVFSGRRGDLLWTDEEPRGGLAAWAVPWGLEGLDGGTGIVWVCMSEADCLAMSQLGRVATTVPLAERASSGAWTKEALSGVLGRWVRWRDVVVLCRNSQESRESGALFGKWLKGEAQRLDVLHVTQVIPDMCVGGGVAEAFGMSDMHGNLLYTRKEVMALLAAAEGRVVAGWRGGKVRANGDMSSAQRCQRDFITMVMNSGWQFYVGDDGDEYAEFEHGNHVERRPVGDEWMASKLRSMFYAQFGAPMSDRVLAGALSYAVSVSGARQRPRVSLRKRVAQVLPPGGDARGLKVYYDLVNDGWEAVEVTAAGWRVLRGKDVPRLFWRPAFARAQVAPVAPPGDPALWLEDAFTRHFAPSTNTFLFAAVVVAALAGPRQYPLVCLVGAPGSGKTTTMNLVKRLVDPHGAGAGGLPPDDANRAPVLKEQYLTLFDNVGGVDAAAADFLCRVCTGGSVQARKYYTNSGLDVVDVQGKVMMTSIRPVIRASDLIDRSVTFTFDRLGDYATAEQVEARFERDLPMILGAAFSVISRAIPIYAALDADASRKWSRLASFDIWLYAVGEALRPGCGGAQAQEEYYTHREGMVGTKARAKAPSNAQRDRDAVMCVVTAARAANGGEYPGAMMGKAATLAAQVRHAMALARVVPRQGSPVTSREFAAWMRACADDLAEAGVSFEAVVARGEARFGKTWMIWEGARPEWCAVADPETDPRYSSVLTNIPPGRQSVPWPGPGPGPGPEGGGGDG